MQVDVRNLNDIEAKAILLLNEIEAAIAAGEAVPWRIVNAASLVKQAIQEEDAQLGSDLVNMCRQHNKSKVIIF